MAICCKRLELNLMCTLAGGQSFRWKETEGRWEGVFAHRVWVLQQNEDHLCYESFQNFSLLSQENEKYLHSEQENRKQLGFSEAGKDSHSENNELKNEKLLRNYFRLDELNLERAYNEWSSKDDHFKNICNSFQGIRILDQDPVENLFSFICSSNNNISRISSMVQKMCTLFGEEIVCVNGTKYYDFPSISALSNPVTESQLRLAGFGYRAQYVHKSAVKLMELGGRKWLEDLKKLSYHDARQHLMLLPGVGAKVADCVCLMSLGFLEAVPVDTHIFKIASQWYLPSLCNSKTVTPRIHQEVGDFFRNLYGAYAGWAHTILFCSSLKIFDSASKYTRRDKKLLKRRKT